jgi:GT2 family glycosyltransferase
MSSAAPLEVSIVVVAWRAREDVLRCLESLREHVGLSYEAIVVDDGSQDGTPEAVRERFPDARVVAKTVNQGLTAGRNDALPLVTGRRVLMLDADTVVHRGAVETLASVLDEHPEVGLVSPKLLFPDGSLQLSCRRYPPFALPLLRRGPYARLNSNPAPHRRHMMQDFDHETRRPVVWTIGAAQMYRADLPARIGIYDDRISSYGGEDMDWCLRVLAAGLQVWYVPEAQVTHVYQQVTHQSRFGAKSRRQLRDFYYVQWKHRRTRRSPLVALGNG